MVFCFKTHNSCYSSNVRKHRVIRYTQFQSSKGGIDTAKVLQIMLRPKLHLIQFITLMVVVVVFSILPGIYRVHIRQILQQAFLCWIPGLRVLVQASGMKQLIPPLDGIQVPSIPVLTGQSEDLEYLI